MFKTGPTMLQCKFPISFQLFCCFNFLELNIICYLTEYSKYNCAFTLLIILYCIKLDGDLIHASKSVMYVFQHNLVSVMTSELGLVWLSTLPVIARETFLCSCSLSSSFCWLIRRRRISSWSFCINSSYILLVSSVCFWSCLSNALAILFICQDFDTPLSCPHPPQGHELGVMLLIYSASDNWGLFT